MSRPVLRPRIWAIAGGTVGSDGHVGSRDHLSHRTAVDDVMEHDRPLGNVLTHHGVIVNNTSLLTPGDELDR
jgi:hypothetical protein